MTAQTQMRSAPSLDPLLAANAEGELAELHYLRAVAAAAEQGRTQREIAATLGISQSAVYKILVKARHTPALFEQSPWEVALRYAAGEITRDTMLDTFGTWPWTTDRVLDADEPEPEQFVRGNWGELSRAVRRGYLSREDYEVVFKRTA